MCGLVGTLVLPGNRFRVDQTLLTRMRDTMIHRGPDGSGTWVSPDGRVGLAHRRLSIVDLSESAAQPMGSRDAALQLVFNGEIYNHAEIRQTLCGLGHRDWSTDHSDTEVVLRAFAQWGIGCLERFRGMFALAIWDARAQELWLVRDRIGIKPMYYCQHHGRISFASEIKALLADSSIQRDVDEEALFHYLSFLTTPGPQTLFRGIKKLPPGSWLKVAAAGSVTQHRYWDVWDHTQPLVGVDEQEIAERLLQELNTAVALRKVGDVPVGVFLSGGIDSSTNAALFSAGEQQPVQTFTIGYEGQYGSYQNETEYARFMADQVGADYHEKLLTADDLIDFLPQMVHLQDEPIADPVCVPVYYVSQLARQNGVTVCQVGEGADELFWGYAGWKNALTVQRWNDIPVPNFIKSLGVSALSRMGKQENLYFEWLRRASNRQPVFWGGAEAFINAQKFRLLSPRLRKQFAGFTSWEALRPIHDRFQQAAWETSHLNWMSYLDLNLRLPELLLMRVDKMSMGVSLEGRVPFLDHKFVELAMSVPEAVKTRNGESKRILKRAVRGTIPDRLIDRKKQGFGVPVYEWFFGRLGHESRRILDQFCGQTDFLDRNQVLDLIDQGHGPSAWYVLNLALWWKHFIAQEDVAHLFLPGRRSAA